IDIDVGAEFLGERRAIASESDGSNAISELLRELNPQMTESPNSLNGDQIARQCAGVSQSVERGDSRAHQRGGFRYVKRLGHMGPGFHRRHHEFRIASVIADSANLHVHAVDEIASPARHARAVLAAVPADTNALAFLPAVYPGSCGIDHAGDL